MPVLLCDLGNVLLGVSFEPVLRACKELNGAPLALEDARELEDDAYRAFEAGVLGESEYARHLRARLGWQGGDDELVNAWGSALGAVDLDVLQLLGELRAEGWTVIGATNVTPWLESELWRRYADPLSVFHRVVTSMAVHVRKPDPRFFTEALRGVGQPGLRLFIDDRPENVSGARRAGLDAHLFRDAEGMRSACLSLGAPVL